jgi:hypothetical protein
LQDEYKAQLLLELIESGELPASASRVIMYDLLKLLEVKFDYRTAKDVEDHMGWIEFNSLIQCPFCWKPLRRVLNLLSEGGETRKIRIAWFTRIVARTAAGVA